MAIEAFRADVVIRLAQMADQLEGFARGNLSFESTETWRTLYQQVLLNCECKRYLSVALVLTEDYWRHPPGDQTLMFNYQLVWRGFHIERVFIIDDFLWPSGARLPCTELRTWIQEQSDHGIRVSVLRTSELRDERELLRDYGIYGELAVGYQLTDTAGLTERYKISFCPKARRLAEDRWAKLALYARSWEQILDRAAS